ncbi:hypothetical protein EVAR_41443_1 [Eumeta japonica]|uniref:Uncharacterized protein n=1 Tax=Eumeta variegata TaxID=151549 RepID=A0A4C1W5C1_EUMVA|nr:hypothetical protein EVAR_41443_1 [Eumeta japonica]
MAEIKQTTVRQLLRHGPTATTGSRSRSLRECRVRILHPSNDLELQHEGLGDVTRMQFYGFRLALQRLRRNRRLVGVGGIACAKARLPVPGLTESANGDCVATAMRDTFLTKIVRFSVRSNSARRILRASRPESACRVKIIKKYADTSAPRCGRT